MANTNIRLDDGQTIRVQTPDGLDKEQTRAFLVSEGMLPSTAGLSPFLPQKEGSASAAQAIALGRFAAERGLGEDVGSAGQASIEQAQPIASLAGQAIPFTAGGPGFFGNVGVAGGLEALREGSTLGSTAFQGLLGGAGQKIGQGVGAIVGRVTNAISGAVRSGAESISRNIKGLPNSLTMPSGIRTTVGKLLGSRGIQQAEASAARNPVTSGPFSRIDEANEAVSRGKLLKWLGVADAPSLETGIGRAANESVAKMDEAIPPGLDIDIPEPVARLFKKLQATAERGAFDFPDNRTITGSDLRAIISDLRAGARSANAATRRNSRAALEQVGREVLEPNPAINQELWAEGSQQYGRWLKATSGRAISKVDPEKINPTTLLNNLERGSKAAVRTRGGIKTGDDALDDLIRTLDDHQRVGSLTPDSGTPTGLALPIVAADIVATGGLGTLGAAVTSRALESPVGAGAAAGLAQASPFASRAGGIFGRSAGLSFGDLLLEDEPDEQNNPQGQ